MGDDRRPSTDELAEWLVYLREIGVRELRASSASLRLEGVSRPPARQQSAVPPATTAEPRAATSRAPALIGLEEGLLGPRPSDPGRRLAEIRDEIGECTRCRLSEARQNVVFGVGAPDAGLMFIGEGPGADEDARGEPFVGRAGKKLDEMIQAIGLSRGQVYIANVVKCRPPDNRTPLPDEVGTCSPFLLQQIAAIRPRVIVTLGSPATQTLLNTRVGITRLRGQWQEYLGIPVMPTFHPAYLLRAYTPENRRKVWEDLKAARARLDEGP